eukprot:m51a1_g8694 hypothetical protein (381) ;mRNA; r:49677-51234
MNSRQRVLAALELRETDRVPVDFAGHRASGISAVSYARLLRRLGAAPAGTSPALRVSDPVQQLALVDDWVLDRLGVDTLAEPPCPVHPSGLPSCEMPVWAQPQRSPGGTAWALRSPEGLELGTMRGGTSFFEQAHYPLAGLPAGDDEGALDAAWSQCLWSRFPPPPGPGPHDPALLEARARELRLRHPDKALVLDFGGSLMEAGQRLYGAEEFLRMLACDRARADAFLERAARRHLRDLELVLGAVGGCADVVVFADDLGMQTGPLISPRMQLLPDLIDAGIDALNPVQFNCAGMDAAGLKRDFGSRIAFWGGGCDTSSVLPRGSAAEVARHVRGQIAQLGPRGFVFQQVANVLEDVPPENVLAMFAAVAESTRANAAVV